ncbi:MAG: hypothetical protein O3C05_02465 [Proteobacteria bacterium]|nr:hypothetical protein [Pseudomonadota bacterium]
MDNCSYIDKIAKHASIKLYQDLQSLLNCKLYVGIELEFYLRDAQLQQIQDISLISAFQKSLQKNYSLVLQEEKGEMQFEISTSHMEFSTAIEYFLELKKNIIKEAAINNLSMLFDAKPFARDYGSAMHIHISLHEKNSGRNMFASQEGILKNTLMQYAVNGILEMINPSIYLFNKKSEDFLRYTENHIMAPTHISWGINNRTTAIRIPNSDCDSRRIEFRIPPASADPYVCMLFIIFSMIYGIKMKKMPICPLYGNAFDAQYNLKPIICNIQTAKQNFMFDKLLENYLNTSFSN